CARSAGWRLGRGPAGPRGGGAMGSRAPNERGASGAGGAGGSRIPNAIVRPVSRGGGAAGGIRDNSGARAESGRGVTADNRCGANSGVLIGVFMSRSPRNCDATRRGRRFAELCVRKRWGLHEALGARNDRCLSREADHGSERGGTRERRDVDTKTGTRDRAPVTTAAERCELGFGRRLHAGIVHEELLVRLGKVLPLGG